MISLIRFIYLSSILRSFIETCSLQSGRGCWFSSVYSRMFDNRWSDRESCTGIEDLSLPNRLRFWRLLGRQLTLSRIRRLWIRRNKLVLLAFLLIFNIRSPRTTQDSALLDVPNGVDLVGLIELTEIISLSNNIRETELYRMILYKLGRFIILF